MFAIDVKIINVAINFAFCFRFLQNYAKTRLNLSIPFTGAWIAIVVTCFVTLQTIQIKEHTPNVKTDAVKRITAILLQKVMNYRTGLMKKY